MATPYLGRYCFNAIRRNLFLDQEIFPKPVGRYYLGAAPQRVVIAAGIGSIMFSFSLILLGALDKDVAEALLTQSAGRTLLLLYVIVVIIITTSGLFVGYSAVFGTREASSERPARKRWTTRQLTVVSIIFTILFGGVSLIIFAV